MRRECVMCRSSVIRRTGHLHSVAVLHVVSRVVRRSAQRRLQRALFQRSQRADGLRLHVHHAGWDASELDCVVHGASTVLWQGHVFRRVSIQVTVLFNR